MLLFIVCIQKSRKLFDCIEHILRAQYHGKSYFLHFQKLIQTKNRVAQQKFHGNNRTWGSNHKSFTLGVVKKNYGWNVLMLNVFFLTNWFGMEPLSFINLSVFSCNFEKCGFMHSCQDVQRVYLSGFDDNKIVASWHSTTGHPCSYVLLHLHVNQAVWCILH